MPEHETQFVLQKAREHSVGLIADELGKLGLGGNNFGQIVLPGFCCALGHGFVNDLISLALRADGAVLRGFIIKYVLCRQLGGAILFLRVVRHDFILNLPADGAIGSRSRRRHGCGGRGRVRFLGKRKFIPLLRCPLGGTGKFHAGLRQRFRCCAG